MHGAHRLRRKEARRKCAFHWQDLSKTNGSYGANNGHWQTYMHAVITRGLSHATVSTRPQIWFFGSWALLGGGVREYLSVIWFFLAFCYVNVFLLPSQLILYPPEQGIRALLRLQLELTSASFESDAHPSPLREECVISRPSKQFAPTRRHMCWAWLQTLRLLVVYEHRPLNVTLDRIFFFLKGTLRTCRHTSSRSRAASSGR